MADELPDLDKPAVPSHGSSSYKMVIMVRSDLKMGIGKIAAQVGHAVLSSYKMALTMNPVDVAKWEDNGCAKIVLKVKDTTELMTIAENAKKDGLPVSIIQDAGLTQIEPGTVTVSGIGPAETSRIDKHTRQLQLL